MGLISYYEICQRLSQGWTREWSNEQAVPFAYQGIYEYYFIIDMLSIRELKGQQWVGYDDEDSLEIKVNKFIGMGF